MGWTSGIVPFASGAMDLVAPERCVLCGRDPGEAPARAFPLGVAARAVSLPVVSRVLGLPVRSRLACRCCVQSLVPAPPRLRLSGASAGDGVAGSKAPGADALEVQAPFLTEETLLALVHAWKFQRVRAVGRILARAMCAVRPRLPPGAVLVPVPTDSASLRRRGFNQAADLARFAGEMVTLPVVGGALVRTGPHTRQSLLGAAGRAANVAGAFEVVRGDGIRGRAVVVVDDLVTTGATVRALAGVVRAAGAGPVQVWCAAFTPPARRPGVRGRSAFLHT